jgi:hypothetical protein
MMRCPGRLASSSHSSRFKTGQITVGWNREERVGKKRQLKRRRLSIGEATAASLRTRVIRRRDPSGVTVRTVTGSFSASEGPSIACVHT